MLRFILLGYVSPFNTVRLTDKENNPVGPFYVARIDSIALNLHFSWFDTNVTGP
ncbi:MAG: hypothetical protein OXG78_01280 [Chloroflexi bacterium]|nr:hypothetical protein [Chloroflexota bacterium]